MRQIISDISFGLATALVMAVIILVFLVSIGYANAQGLYGLQQGWMQADQLRYHLRPQFWDIQPDANGVQPIPIIPPLGARACSPVRVCDGYGTACVWQQVCR